MTVNPDPLIDEVRGLRQALCEAAGNDVDRLIARLREVEADFHARRGAFTGMPRASAGDVFPEAAAPEPDPLLDEVHRLRGGR